MRPSYIYIAPLLMAAFFNLTALPACRAQVFGYQITTETSGLAGHPAGPFTLDFQLTDGSGSLDANNTVTLSGFRFAGGGATGPISLLGGASGDVSSAITLTDSSFLSEAMQPFDPGTSLTFDASFNSNADVGPTPDELSFKILDGSGTEIPTTGPDDSLLIAKFYSPSPYLATFRSDPFRSPTGGGDAFMPGIVTTASTSAVPEPGPAAILLGAGVCGSVLLLHRRRKRAGLRRLSA